MFCIFFDCCVNIFYGIFYAWDSLFNLCILLVMLTSAATDLFSSFSSPSLPLFVICFSVFYKGFFFLFKGFYLFACVFLYFFSELFISSLKVSIFMRWDFRSASWFSGVLRYPGLAVVGWLFSWWQNTLASLAYVLAFASCHLVSAGVNWPGCLCLEPASLETSRDLWPGLEQASGRQVVLSLFRGSPPVSLIRAVLLCPRLG